MTNSYFRNSHALVVEGGAMRGVFAAGVLDRFIDEKLNQFDFCIGVSAGACNLASWVSGQKRRSHKIFTEYSLNKNFINAMRFLKGGCLFDLDWLWNYNAINCPIDMERFSENTIPFYITVTDKVTGKASYLPASKHNLDQLLKSTCSVPYFSSNNDGDWIDGGLSDSIPVIEAYNRGAREITVILSKPIGYVKTKSSFLSLLKFIFWKNKDLIQYWNDRYKSYNEAIEFILNPPERCKVNVISPGVNFPVNRLTKNVDKLNMGYLQGYKYDR